MAYVSAALECEPGVEQCELSMLGGVRRKVNARKRILRLKKSRRSVEFFYADYFVAQERNEDGFRWRIAVDPVFGFVALFGALADFVIGAAERGDHHVVIHSYERAIILNGFFIFWRQRVDPIYRRGFFVLEVQHGGEIVLQIIRAHVWKCFAVIEQQRDTYRLPVLTLDGYGSAGS